MRIRALITFATAIAAIGAVPASAEAPGRVVDLLPGHPVYHESEREAGVVMAISITPGPNQGTDLMALCEELRGAAGLARHNDHVPLEVIFVVPYKGMTIEGYYLPADSAHGSEALIRGDDIARAKLDGIVARAGIPAHILDETAVEHEVSCELGEPAWLLRWEDIRPVADAAPDPVIESAHRRFLAIHQSVVAHAKRLAVAADLQTVSGAPRTRSLAATTAASAPGQGPQVFRPQP